MPTYPFLSTEWIAAAREIYESSGGGGAAAAAAPAIKMNQIVTGVPFGEGRIDTHLDTTGGAMQLDLGHLADPEVTITAPYAVVKAIFIDGDAAAAMQAFMSGQIKVEGDLTKLMALQGAAPGPDAFEIQQRIKAITE